MIDACMKRQVISVSPATTAPEAAHVVVSNHIGTLPVVDDLGVLVGVVRLEDLLKVFMPDFVSLMDNIDFVRDFGALETLRPQDVPEAARLTMRDLMQPPVAVERTCGLLRAFATMTKHQIRDLPVVNAAGALVGIASRVDIAAAFLAPWTRTEPKP
jgi:CBS-domain-containing membrane protein